MVVTSEPCRLSTVVMQERVAVPSTCTVQAPHSAMPQPNLVPVMPSTSRNTQSSGVSLSTSTRCVVPFTLMLTAMASASDDVERDVDIAARDLGIGTDLVRLIDELLHGLACDARNRDVVPRAQLIAAVDQ